MPDNSDLTKPFRSSYAVRCPACGYEDDDLEDYYRELLNEGGHTVDCVECGCTYTMTTYLDITFETRRRYQTGERGLVEREAELHRKKWDLINFGPSRDKGELEKAYRELHEVREELRKKFGGQ